MIGKQTLLKLNSLLALFFLYLQNSREVLKIKFTLIMVISLNQLSTSTADE